METPKYEKATLTPLSARGEEDDTKKSVAFCFQSIDDTLTRSIVTYEAPYTNGAYSDDLGASPRKITFAAVFRGGEYANHTAFTQTVSTHKLLWRLDHPIYTGEPLKGRITSVTIKHAKYLYSCEVQIEFVETIDKGEPVKYVNIRTGEWTAKEGIGDIENKLGKSFEEEKDSYWLADIEGKIARFKGIISELTAPINSITAGIKVIAGLPGEVISSCLTILESLVAVTESIKALPEMMTTLAFQTEQGANLINSILNSPEDFKKNFNACLAACYASLSSAYVGRRLAQDEETRVRQLSSELVESFDLNGRLNQTANFDGRQGTDTPMLSADEMEAVLITHHELMDKAIEGLREIPDLGEVVTLLSSQKRLFSDYIVSMIIKTGAIRTVKPPFQINLFTLLHREGLSYKACERVAALNQAPNPIFYEGEVRIYAK